MGAASCQAAHVQSGLVPEVVVYVSGHGFGHAVRVAEVLGALGRLAPELDVEVRTAAPPWLFPKDARVVRRSLDIGVIQRDSLRVEPRETLARYAAFVRDEPGLVAAEATELAAGGVRLVVADVPSAAFDVAARVGAPSVGLANFCWDWVYAPYVRAAPEHAGLLGHLRAQHARADLLLRLPFHGDLSCFQRAVDVPPIARYASADRLATRRQLGLPTEARVVLLSFGGFDFAGLDVDRLAGLGEYAFVTAGARADPSRVGNLFCLPREEVSYLDLLAASDAVVGKLGYGLVGDCLANRVPLLYTPRGRFREEPILAGAIERLGRATRLPRAALRRWDLRPHLEALLESDRPWAELRLDGAEVVAGHLLRAMG